MGQAVTVANASGDRLYVKVQSSVQLSEKTDFALSGSAPFAAVETTAKVDVEVDGNPLPLGFVAIENGQSLKFARSIFTRRLLTVTKPQSKGRKVFICHQFLVPYLKNIVVAPNHTIRYAKIGHKWVDIDGVRYKDRRSSASSGQTHSIQTL